MTGPRGIALAAALIVGCGPSAPAPDRPDVLLITIDTLRADFLGSYGFSRDTTPAIDALAAEGVLFERAIAASALTAPSHASIMTSLYPRQHTVGHRNGATLLADAPTLAEHFQRAGYTTAGFVGNIMVQAKLGFDRGFDVFDDELTDPEPNRPRVYERVADETLARALRWLDGAEGPVFLWVHLQDPHGPYTPPRPFAREMRLRPGPDERPLPVHRSDSGRDGIPNYQALPGLRYPSEYRGRYAGEVRYADRAVRRLVSTLDARRGRATVLLTADHGESMGENHRYFVHGYASTPELARVPFVLRADGLPPARVSGVVHHVDVLPTLLELAGLDVPEDARGIALGPPLREGAALPDRLVFCDTGGEVTAYGADRFVRAIGVGGAWEGTSPDPLWFAYRWEAPGDWSLVEGEGERHAEVQRYVDVAVPMRFRDQPSPEEIERMRALGYTE